MSFVSISMLRGRCSFIPIFFLLFSTLLTSYSSPFASAFNHDDVIEATSLHTCMDNSKLTADHFKVAFTPINNTISYTVNITSEIQGNVLAYIDVYAYGFKVVSERIDPCTINAAGLCPVYPGSNYIASTTRVSDKVIKSIPSIAFKFPDIDAFVVVKIVENSKVVACIEADLSNRKTVNHTSVKWVTAIIAGIGLLVSAIVSTLGSTYTAAHIAANSVSLFTYFQSVVIVSMCAVQQMPPIASAWAQNLAWSVGLININFMQKIFRWYVAATGGTPTQNIFSPTISVLVQKRNVIPNMLTQNSRMLLHSLSRRVFNQIAKRDDKYVSMPAKSTDTLLVLRGIQRTAYQANIERTSAVLTAFTFFVLICVAMTLCFWIFYGIVALSIKANWMQKSRFSYFRSHCFVMLKGTLLRLLFIAFPSLLLFSFWEFVQQDSAAVIVLAVFFLILSLGILGWSSAKVFLIGKQSARQHNTPAYLLFSDPHVLNRYGFLYVPYKAFSYYFVIPVLGYIFVKVCFVSFAQSSGKTQGIVLFVIELVYLIALSYFKPYMDKSTNVINIIIATVMMVNAFLVMFFSQLFNTPRAVASVMGVVFFILNAIFSLILLLYTLVSCCIVLLSRNPDNRYKPAADDRAAFIRDTKEGSDDVAELTALGVSARAGHEDEFMEGSGVGGVNEGNGRGYPRSESNYEMESKNVRSSIESLSTGNPFAEKNGSNMGSNVELSNLNNLGKPTRSSASAQPPHLVPSRSPPPFPLPMNGGAPLAPPAVSGLGNNGLVVAPGVRGDGILDSNGSRLETGSRDSRDSYNMDTSTMPSGSIPTQQYQNQQQQYPNDLSQPSNQYPSNHQFSSSFSNSSLNVPEPVKTSSSQSHLNSALENGNGESDGKEKRKSKWKIF